jgi:Ni/Fe-hydrogenase subunit HybB-like protein
MSRPVRVVKDVLWVLALIGALAIVFRLVHGLGPTTNLNDALPWGLWKILNMVAGVALATGGFTVGLLVYVLGIERLRPLIKPAILVAFLGYGSSVFALMIDIGLPHRIWHPFLMWNPRSFLFEVAMCVAFYFTTTIVEMAPTVAERFPRAHRLAHTLHRLTPAIVIVGITLSSLHHTSLGSLFLVTPTRLHPLWYTGWLPVLFITSAMGAGMMVTVLAWMAWARLFDPAPVFGSRPHRWEPIHGSDAGSATEWEPRDLPMLRLLASIATGVLGAYLVLKLVDLARTGAWRELLGGSWESGLYLAELALVAVVPLLIMLVPAARRRPAGIGWAAASAAAGMTLNRLSVGIFGYFHDAERIYLPSAIEWAVSLGVLAAAGLVMLWIGERFPVFEHLRSAERAEDPLAYSDPGRKLGLTVGDFGSRLERVLLLAVFALPLGWIAVYPPFHDERVSARQPTAPPRSVDPERTVLTLDANRAGLSVEFPHAEHRERADKDDTCGRCHHLSLPGDHRTACSRCHGRVWSGTPIFDHAAHLEQVAADEELGGLHPGNRSCRFCHPEGRAHRTGNGKACAECHEQDMNPARKPESAHEWRIACGYLPAVHGTCMPCHEEESAERHRPKLGECTNCHPGASRGDEQPERLRAAAARPAGGRRRK